MTGRSLARLSVLVPPLREQRRIVAVVSQLMKTCDELEEKLSQRETIASRMAEALTRAAT